nr:annexin [Palleronia pontilimi]
MPVSGGDYATANKLEAVARAQTGSFSAATIAQQLRAAMDQIGTDEAQIYRALNGLTALQGAVVRKMYRARYDRDLDYDLRDELSGDEQARAMAQIEGRQAEGDAIALHDAVAGLGTDEAAIMELLRNKTPAEVAAIRAAYLQRYGESLDDALRDDLAEGNEQDQAEALLRGDVATADAIALDEAMRGGLTGWGTSEEEIERVYTRTRSEVLAMAQRENWTAEEMEAEVRRRLRAIEARFGERYANVAQYNRPGLAGGTVLERAFASELSGPERDLANALQGNNLVAADAARIEIERRGVYASDDAINDVLRSQYERALEARRLDEGPARQMRVRRLVDELRDRRPPLSENEISRQRIALERQMEREMEDGAQEDSRLSMGELRDVYQDRYFWPLSFAIETSMSGEDRNRARNMLQQGGRLTPLQEVEYATRTVGTDEAALRRVLTRMTRAEIQQLREQWEQRHPGRSFNAMLRSELTGRDASDIMDAVYHGAPETDEERIRQEERRVHREINHLTGVLGGAAAGNEADWMENELARLRALRAPLLRTDWPDTPEARAERERLSARVDERVQAVQDAVADHRRRIDAVTDFATQVIGIAVGVTVAVVLGAVSGGTLGVATIALMASLMATASTITTKILIKGGSYGIDDYGIDLAVGVVDAITAVATAGMGSRLIAPLRALAQRTRVGDVVGWMGRTGLARRMAQAPGAATVRGLAGRAGLSREGLERGAAAFLAEGIEDAVGAAPSSFVQIALTDATWEGDPLKNFLESGGMALLQAVAMGRMMAGGMSVGQRGFAGLRGVARSRTEVGRLLEANRILQDGYARYREDNPGASIGDFLASPLGREARATIERRGLMRDIEAANRAAENPLPAREAQARAAAEADAPPPGRAAAEAEADARAAALEAAIPAGLREGTFVSPDPVLPGRTVRVEPLRIGRRIVGVEVRVGPDATPMDIAMHAATVHAMQKYRGTLGNIRRALADMAATITGSGLQVGSRGWEARLEIGKLPAIIAERMDALSGRALTPDAEARVLADIARLEAQFHHHEAVFANPALRDQPGRGYVAAEDGAHPRDFAQPMHEAVGRRIGPEAEEDPTFRAPGRAAGEAEDVAQLELIFGGPIRPEDAAGLDPPPAGALYEAPGQLSPAAQADLALTLARAREAFERAYPEPPADGGKRRRPRTDDRDATALEEARGLLAGLAQRYDLHPADLMAFVAAAEGAGPVAALLPARPDAPTQVRTLDDVRAATQQAVESLQPQIIGPVRPTRPEDLVAEIARGDPQGFAQQRLERMSGAPPHYRTQNFSQNALRATIDPQTGIGFLRIRTDAAAGTKEYAIQISGSRTDPSQPIRYHGYFPPYDQIGNTVVQLYDGALRVWREPPSPDYPEGRLMQESIVRPTRGRQGQETTGPTREALGLTGVMTHRAHAHGNIIGVESPFGIYHAPSRVNLETQAAGVEKYIAALRDAAPEGVTFILQTGVRHHGDQATLRQIDYRISIVIEGHRMDFANFSIRIDRLPDDMAGITQENLVTIEPLEPRSALARLDPERVQGMTPAQVRDTAETLDAVREMVRARVDPPEHVISEGLREAVAAHEMRTRLMQEEPDRVRSTVAASQGRIVDYSPPRDGSYDAQAWTNGLAGIGFNTPGEANYIVVDLRGAHLTDAQRQQIRDAIAALHWNARQKFVVLMPDPPGPAGAGAGAGP